MKTAVTSGGISYSFVAGAIMVILILLAGFRPASSVTIRPTGLLVPLYTPAGDETWATLIQVKVSYPSVPVIAIINPRSGPGSSSDSTFVLGIQNLQAVGITVVGYIPTNYTSTSTSVVENSTRNYVNWYHVNGIFFDQMSNNQTNVSYYSTVSNYAHSQGLTLTIGNPGTSVPASFLGTMNILNIYENSGNPSVSTISIATMGYDRNNFAMIAYNVVAPTQSYLDSVAPYVSYIYFTDGNSPNPFAGLTTYLNNLVLELSSIDGPDTSINNLTGNITLGNNDSTLTFNTGVSHITVSLNPGHANIWTADQTHNANINFQSGHDYGIQLGGMTVVFFRDGVTWFQGVSGAASISLIPATATTNGNFASGFTFYTDNSANQRFVMQAYCCTAAGGGKYIFSTGGTPLPIVFQNQGVAGFTIRTNSPGFQFGESNIGSGSAALGSNSPAANVGHPYDWVRVECVDGSGACYIPEWK